MYRLMIADDEIDKLESLRDNYDWKKYNVSICCEAKDGLHALELLVKQRPDICIMDVNMPIMSGLEAMKRAETEGVNTKFIILSGYDDFKYAQEAIKLSSVEYLLKPCRFSDITQAVLKCIAMIDKEKMRHDLAKKYTELSEISNISLKNNFLISLLKGKNKNSSALNQNNIPFDLNTVADCFSIIVITFDNNELSEIDDNDMVFASTKEYIANDLSRYFACETVDYNNYIVSIASVKNIYETFEIFVEKLRNISYFIKSHFYLDSAIGISDIKSSIADFHAAFLEAEMTANASIFFLDQQITFFAEMGNFKYEYPQKLAERVLLSIKNGEDEVIKSIDDFFSFCKFKSIDSKRQIQNMAVTLIYNIVEYKLKENSSNDNISQSASQSAQKILCCNNLQGVKDIVVKFIIPLSQQSDKKSISAIVKRAVAFINVNYCEKLSLESVAEEIHLSPSYLSMLFKQQIGTNLIKYLNRCRIEKSKEFLCDLNLRTSEIAYKVGFQDEKYFYLLFKRYVGLTPTQYRDRSVNKKA